MIDEQVYKPRSADCAAGLAGAPMTAIDATLKMSVGLFGVLALVLVVAGRKP